MFRKSGAEQVWYKSHIVEKSNKNFLFSLGQKLSRNWSQDDNKKN